MEEIKVQRTRAKFCRHQREKYVERMTAFRFSVLFFLQVGSIFLKNIYNVLYALAPHSTCTNFYAAQISRFIVGIYLFSSFLFYHRSFVRATFVHLLIQRNGLNYFFFFGFATTKLLPTMIII